MDKISGVSKKRQVIIGNSASGLNAIKAIREVDRACPITLISAENCNAYSPVLLTYYLKGLRTRDELFIVNSDFYRMNDIKVLFGNKAIIINPLQQIVYLDNRMKVNYDNLLVATGASSLIMGSSNDRFDNIFTLRTIDDAEKILECAKTSKEIIIIGAGLIGLQTADALSGKNVNLTIIELAEGVLPETIDAGSAQIIREVIEAHGVSVLLGERVEEIKKAGKKSIVILNSGKELIADMVVVGIGLKPNMQLTENSGIKINKGILVDELMQTNINNIFAAGDVSEGENLVTGGKEILPNWINACKQGRIAGLNMAGCKMKYEGGVKGAITTIFGLTIAVLGLSKSLERDGVEELCFSEPTKKRYRKILFSGNRIVGVVLLNKTDDAGILGGLIRNKKDIALWKEKIAQTPLDIREVLLSVNNC